MTGKRKTGMKGKQTGWETNMKSKNMKVKETPMNRECKKMYIIQQ